MSKTEKQDNPEVLLVDLTSLSCPRCQEALSGDYYGPCENCYEQLRAEQQNQSEAAEAPEYEPKMNVTPNAVALKE